MSIKKHVKLGLSALALSVSFGSINTAFAAEDPIKVGILHSLSGTMAISETALKDTMLMLVEEQNKKTVTTKKEALEFIKNLQV